MHPEDWPDAAAVYEEGLKTGLATFETEIPSWEQWDLSHLQRPRLLIEKNGAAAGWAALSPVSPRPVYHGVAEVSIYIRNRFTGQGAGEKLLSHLEEAGIKEGIWMLQAVIFSENKSSLRLHEKAGFRTVGFREKIGCLHGVWHNTILMEKRNSLGLEESD